MLISEDNFMTIQTRFKFEVLLFICLIYGVKMISACEIPGGISLERSIKESAIVFSGKVLGYEYRNDIPNSMMDSFIQKSGLKMNYQTEVVKIQVNQWWKGDLPKVIYLVRNNTMSPDGMQRFWGGDYFFRRGENYLVFASGKENEYKSNNCTRTRLLIYAKKDLEVLGKGKKYKNEELTKKPKEQREKTEVPFFKFRKLKIGMTSAEAEKKLGFQLVFKNESNVKNSDFKIVGIKGRDTKFAGLRFYKHILYAIFIVYEKEQWGTTDELTSFVSKELKSKSPWTNIVEDVALMMKAIYFPTYQIIVISNEIEHTLYISDEKIMNLLRSSMKQ